MCCNFEKTAYDVMAKGIFHIISNLYSKFTLMKIFLLASKMFETLYANKWLQLIVGSSFLVILLKYLYHPTSVGVEILSCFDIFFYLKSHNFGDMYLKIPVNPVKIVKMFYDV